MYSGFPCGKDNLLQTQAKTSLHSLIPWNIHHVFVIAFSCDCKTKHLHVTKSSICSIKKACDLSMHHFVSDYA